MSTPFTQAPRRRITMRDIALKLGIDRSTVSLSLRGHPRISKALRQKVEETAGQMGYRPDAMLSALAYYRHTTTPSSAPGLAWINRGASAWELRSKREINAFYEGAKETSKNNGYVLHDLWLDPEEPLSRSRKLFKTHNIKGLLIPPNSSEGAWDGIEWENYAVLGFGYSAGSLPIHCVMVDQMHAGVIAFEKAYAKGYRRIGLCTGRDGMAQAWRYVSGFLLAQSEVPNIEPLPILKLDGIDPMEDRKLLLEWLKRTSVEAIFTTLSNTRSLLESVGYRVPEDVALAASSPIDSDVDAGINNRSSELGKVAVETLISHLNHNRRGIPKVMCSHTIEPQWVDGTCLPER